MFIYMYLSHDSMSSKRKIGQVSQKSEVEWNIEWSIKDILSYTKVDEEYESPDFSIPGSLWHLSIYPNGSTSEDEDSIGWISLYLSTSKQLTTPKSVNISFGVRKKDGTIEYFGDQIDEVFEETSEEVGSGLLMFLQRSELEERMSELAPENILTVTCTLTVEEDIGCIPRLVNLSADFKDMFLSKRYCDATLRVKEEEFSVHRSVLETRSPVFASMFEIDMKEKETGVVNIADCDPGAFRDFLLYLYSGEHGNFPKNVFELYKITDKYDVQELKSNCVSFILGNVSCENVFDAVILAHTFDESEIKSKAQDFFNEHFDKIASTAEWDSFLKENHTLAVEMLKNMAEKRLKK